MNIDTKVLNPGDCILIGGKSFVSRGIKWFTNSKYSHVALYVGGGEAYVIEATAAGVERTKFISLLKRASNLCIRRIPDLKVDEAELIKQKAYSLLYQNYDYFQFISMIPYFLMRKLFGVNWTWLLFNKRTKMICSELVAICYYAAGIEIAPYKKIKSITPNDLYKSKKMITVIEHNK